MLTPNTTVLGLDVGAKRVGVAVGSSVTRFAHPLVTLEVTSDIFQRLAQLVADHGAATVVVGLPRGLDGQTTAQTRATQSFIDTLKSQLQIPVEVQDEALTSVTAESELTARTKTYKKVDVDALAATLILEDFLATKEVRI